MWYKFILCFVFLFFCYSCNKEEPNQNNKNEILPTLKNINSNSWKLVETLSDEFNELNLEKWNNFYPDWNGRLPSWFIKNNVTVVEGEIHITMKKEILEEMEQGYEYSTGIIRSTNSFKYGFCEVKAKCMSSAGSSSFFLNNVQADWWTEIDVYEVGGNASGFENMINTNIHEFYNPTNVTEPYFISEETHFFKSESFLQNWRPDEDYHVYGIEWMEDKIKWYLDGELIRSEENTRWHQELFINLDSEIIIDWFGIPNNNDLPSIYHIDYVRTWQVE